MTLDQLLAVLVLLGHVRHPDEPAGVAVATPPRLKALFAGGGAELR